MKKYLGPVIGIGALIVVIALVVVFGLVLGREKPSTEVMDLTDYFSVKAKDEVITFVDNVREDVEIKRMDGDFYLPLSVAKSLNDRFYWDKNEQVMIYITNDKILKIKPGDDFYFENNSKVSYDSVILNQAEDNVYLSLDFLESLSGNVRHEVCELPTRLMITTVWDKDEEYATVARDTQIRYGTSIQTPILRELVVGDTMYYLGEDEIEGKKWAMVLTDDGVKGYVLRDCLEEEIAVNSTPAPTDGYKEEFTHIFKDGHINMLWHQVWGTAANSEISTILTTSPGINVVAPTWFFLNDNEGNFYSNASESYVEACHNKGIQVWATFNNIDNPDVDTTAVLTNTSIRENMENQIIIQALNYKLDGINMDFEGVSASTDDAYVQFIRELAIKCHGNGLILSVDNTVPMGFSAFYRRGQQSQFADYVVLMAYDEHYSGSDAGSVSSLGFVRDGVKNTLADGVPANQLVLGLPFYTRDWKETPKDIEDDSVEAATEGFKAYDTTSEVLIMAEARKRAEAEGVSTTWDAECGQYYCEYQIDNVTHKIWVEDAKSLREKLNVMKDNNLAGCAFWKAGLETSDVWNVINEYN